MIGDYMIIALGIRFSFLLFLLFIYLLMDFSLLRLVCVMMLFDDVLTGK